MTCDQFPTVSVVAPLYNEEENVRPLVAAVREALADDLQWELLLVDDGSTDDTARRVREAAESDGRVRLVPLARNYGQTTAMQAGFDQSRGDVVVSMDGDLQNDPRDIPRLVEKIEEGFDLVAGYRKGRWSDRVLTRKIPSEVANFLIRQVTGVPIRDNGCSLKAYRRSLLERLHLYSDMHRFIPAVAAATAGARITEVPVRHHPRRRGESKYGLSRIWKVLADLVTVGTIRSFRERPLVLFGLAAAASVLVALAFAGAMAVAVLEFAPDKAVSVVFPGAALLWMGMAFYLVVLGLVAEVVVRRSSGGRGKEPLVREVGP